MQQQHFEGKSLYLTEKQIKDSHLLQLITYDQNFNGHLSLARFVENDDAMIADLLGLVAEPQKAERPKRPSGNHAYVGNHAYGAKRSKTKMLHDLRNKFWLCFKN